MNSKDKLERIRKLKRIFSENSYEPKEEEIYEQ